MTRMLRGKPIVDAWTPDLAARSGQLAKDGISPCLAVVRVGARGDDVAYERSIVRRASEVGVSVRAEALPEDVDTASLARTVRALGDDTGVHGILVFRPLPGDIDEAVVLNAIPPEKDVDGVTKTQMASLYALRPASGGAGRRDFEGDHEIVFFPSTAEAVLVMLDYYKIEINSKQAVVIGRSTVIGKPVGLLLLARNATVTLCHSRTPALDVVTSVADILVVAAGLASAADERLGAEYLKPGQTVIDVAIHCDEDGGLYGDVRPEAAEGLVADFTPVPGGVGSVTALVLLEHVVRAAEGCVARQKGTGFVSVEAPCSSEDCGCDDHER
jgi:methylenetetrahydrofolate dehydrogenase (NADP+)/methenyltetrahydrofolate cyclohydrolase